MNRTARDREVALPGIKLPLLNRTAERTQGCWNCRWSGDVATTMTRWKQDHRPHFDQRVAALKAHVLTLAPKQVKSAIEKIEDMVARADAIEQSIAEGLTVVCTRRQGGAQTDFVSAKFLCAHGWDPATGASVARAGKKADVPTDELKDIYGDGN